MDRRYFLKQTAAIAPFMIAFNPWAAAQSGFLKGLITEAQSNNRILVLIEMNGGNDGLNTFIPIDKYSILSEARKNILIPENKILKLNDTSAFGFHPAMEGMQRLYNDNLLTVIQGVGYPNPDFSHFRGIDIKYSGSTDPQSRSGWLGRYLESTYPKYPANYPLHNTDGPPAIRIGQVSPKVSNGTDTDFGVGYSMDIDSDNLATGSDEMIMPGTMGAANIGMIRTISRQVKLYAPIIQSHAMKQDTLSKLYPVERKNPLADQLKTIAKLIGSGLSTRIYLVNQSGYDTHGDQVEKSDTTLGKHASLLANLSEAVAAFEDDLHLMGRQDQVLGMTFSEFGRRIASSDSYGTDHGTAETVMLFGTKLKSRIMGKSPELPAKVTQYDNLAYEYDFRALYKTVLKDWLGVSPEQASKFVPQAPDQKIDLFSA